MAADHRLVDASGARVPFTCANRRYQTDISKGVAYGLSPTRGSVFDQPLVNHGYSLWLEHVVQIGTGDELYWLMWYDDTGKPTILMSGVFDRDELAHLTGQLATFVPYTYVRWGSPYEVRMDSSAGRTREAPPSLAG